MTIIAYKGFNKDLKCRKFQYEVGETYTIKDRPVACKRGFHACYKLLDINTYYPLKDSRVCIVEILGDIDTDTEEDVVCTNKILIVRELTRQEISKILKAETIEFIQTSADINAKDNDGRTALIRATTMGHVEPVKVLIEAGADVNIKDKDGNTAIIFASNYGYTEIAKELIKAGAK